MVDYARGHDREMAGLLVSVSLGLGLYATLMLGAATGFTLLLGVFLLMQMLLLGTAIILRRWFAVLLIAVFILMTIRH